MRKSTWSLESIPWHLFDPAKIDARLLAQAKGAALVESNAADYVTYLKHVFAGDEEIIADIDHWGEEERLHGSALRRWCEMADPSYDFELAMNRFQNAYRLPLNANESVRGSRARELVARCVVETGTTTYYSALRDAAEEPVLKEICRRIAGDEVRHFHLFLNYLNGRYASEDHLGTLGRVKTILERITEVDDPELTFAHFAANLGDDFDPSQFPEYSQRYMAETVDLYRSRHFQATIPLLSKAAGVPLRPWISAPLGKLFHKAFQFKYQ